LLKASLEMRLSSIFARRKTLVLALLATAVLAAVTYGVVTYQTPYGCGPNGVAAGAGIDWQVLAEPCIYIYFTGIVGGSVLLILFVPVPEKKSTLSARAMSFDPQRTLLPGFVGLRVRSITSLQADH
jgi:hypothetical protein